MTPNVFSDLYKLFPLFNTTDCWLSYDDDSCSCQAATSRAASNSTCSKQQLLACFKRKSVDRNVLVKYLYIQLSSCWCVSSLAQTQRGRHLVHFYLFQWLGTGLQGEHFEADVTRSRMWVNTNDVQGPKTACSNKSDCKMMGTLWAVIALTESFVSVSQIWSFQSGNISAVQQSHLIHLL